MVIFVVAVVPQVIKLFASTGIAWLKAVGACYLTSWLISLVLLNLAEAQDDLSQSKQGISGTHHFPIGKAWSLAAVISHSIFYGCIVWNTVPSIPFTFYALAIPIPVWATLLLPMSRTDKEKWVLDWKGRMRQAVMCLVIGATLQYRLYLKST